MNILMITIGYPPEHVGGTEVYVQGLVAQLESRGHGCAVAYVRPARESGGSSIRVSESTAGQTRIFAVEVDAVQHRLEFILFDADLRDRLIREFRRITSVTRPDVIHFHPLHLGFESYLIEELARLGHRVVLTYHSSTTACARGDLIYMGSEVCDGVVRQMRCTACYLDMKGVPAIPGQAVSVVPEQFFRKAHASLGLPPKAGKLQSFLSIPVLISERMAAWRRATENATAIVAVCNWVRDSIVKNGVSPDKVCLSRHGLRLSGRPVGIERHGIARFGFLGRIRPEKGVRTLVNALRGFPRSSRFEFEFCSSSFAGFGVAEEEQSLVEAVRFLVESDSRVRILEGVSDDDLCNVVAAWDAMVVPSLWLESGPQVVYESFAAKTPVIGSNLGGIAELVENGETGMLFPRGDAKALRSLLLRASADPNILRSLRRNIGPVRTTSDVCDDMLRLYSEVLCLETVPNPQVVAQKAARSDSVSAAV